MKKTSFNLGWKVRKGVAGPFDVLLGFGGEDSDVTLPHDAMLYEPQDTAWKTWDGKVMAVIRSTFESGRIRVTFRTPGLEDARVCLESKA